MNRTLLILTSFLSLQACAQNIQIGSHEEHVEQLKHDLKVWKIRRDAIATTRDLSGVAFLGTVEFTYLTSKYISQQQPDLEKVLTQPTCMFYQYTLLATILASIYSIRTIYGLKQKIKPINKEQSS